LRADNKPSDVSLVPLAAHERLSAAFARYEDAYRTAERDELVAARIELCQVLLECGEDLEPAVTAQLARDRAELERLVSQLQPAGSPEALPLAP
jgi:hypothetical protein